MKKRMNHTGMLFRKFPAKASAGFTLMELIITLLIVGVLVTLGVPSLKTFMQNNRLIAASNDLVSAMNIARSEAIKLNKRVSVCESSDGKSCTTTGKWENGWIVFIDADGDLNNTGATCTGVNTDCLLRIYDGVGDSDLKITGLDPNNAKISSLTFTSRGLPKAISGASQSADFSLCLLDSSNKTINSRGVVLSLSGRVRVSDNSAVITCP